MLKVKIVPENGYAALNIKPGPSRLSHRHSLVFGQLTKQALLNADGLPAFVSANHWVINPYKPWVRYWTVVIAALLVFTATVTPFEIAFLDPALDALFWINRVVDLCFLMDMFVQALMGYLDRKRNRWEVRPKVTIKRYCRTWLLPDTLSVIPYDAIAFCIPNYTFAKLKVLRLLRLVRLVRLVRILKTAELFKRWETQIAVSYSHLKLIRFSVAVLLSAHWLACGFYLVTVLEDQPETWISEYSAATAGNSNLDKPVDNYIVALYWSVMTMSTIGYGDVVPKTQYERLYEICGMMLGASVYAYMVGAICSIVASMNASSAAFNQQMDSLNSFMGEAGLPQPLRAKLREYFRYRRSARSLHDSPALLQAMSPALRAQVASHTQAKWINNVPFFRPLPEHLKIEMALALKTEAYAPFEALLVQAVVREGDKCTRLFILDQGTLSSKGRMLEAGAVVGVQHFLLSRNRWSHAVTTVTYSRLQSLDKDTFDEMLLRYPVAAKSIRRFVLRSVLREDLICYCMGLKHVRQHAKAPHLPDVLPTKEDMHGEHLSQDKYHRTLALLEEAEPNAFVQLKAAATMLQKHWRGIQARKMRHLLQRLVRASVIQTRAAHYSLQSSTVPPFAESSSPVSHNSRAAQPTLSTHRASRGQRMHPPSAKLQPGSNSAYTQRHGILAPVSGVQSMLPAIYNQQEQGGVLGHASQLVSDLQLELTAPHHSQQRDASLVAADVQRADVMQAWGKQAVQPPAVQHQALQQHALQHHAMQVDLGLRQPQTEATAVMACTPAESQGIHHDAEQNQRNSVLQYETSPAGLLAGIDSCQGSVPDEQQSYTDLVTMLVHQQCALAAGLQQMRDEMHTLRTDIVSEFHAMRATNVDKVRLKPLK